MGPLMYRVRQSGYIYIPAYNKLITYSKNHYEKKKSFRGLT